MSNIKVDTIELPEFASEPTAQYRIKVVEDCEEYQMGDAEDEEATRAAINEHGVWGFVVEKWVDAHHGSACKGCGYAPDAMSSGWEHVDSCFGFIGNDQEYMMECALDLIPDGYGEVSVVDENGREINTVVKK